MVIKFFKFHLGLFHEDMKFVSLNEIVLFHIVRPYQSLTFCAFYLSILTAITITHVFNLAKIIKIVTH